MHLFACRKRFVFVQSADNIQNYPGHYLIPPLRNQWGPFWPLLGSAPTTIRYECTLSSLHYFFICTEDTAVTSQCKLFTESDDVSVFGYKQRCCNSVHKSDSLVLTYVLYPGLLYGNCVE
jgi:hypothetical protein